MTDTSLDDLGPVDYLVVEFPAGAKNFTGEMAAELLKLVDAGTIRVIDVLILDKNEDGSVDATSSTHRAVGGVHDRVHLLLGDVPLDQCDVHTPVRTRLEQTHPSKRRSTKADLPIPTGIYLGTEVSASVPRQTPPRVRS